MVIKRVGPVSCAKISGTLYAAIGLILGAIFSMVALAGGMVSNSSNGTGLSALLGGLGPGLTATAITALGIDPYAEYDIPNLATFHRVEDKTPPIREILA